MENGLTIANQRMSNDSFICGQKISFLAVIVGIMFANCFISTLI
jgi:hypothetical protein